MTRQRVFQALALLLLLAAPFFIRTWFEHQHDLRALSRAAELNAEARAQIKIGMTRNEAEALIPGVVIQYQCKTETWASDDYLFYEVHDYSAPLNIVYKRANPAAEERVSAIYTPEGYMVSGGCRRVR